MALGPGLALALVVALGPSQAEASPQIRWEAPLECPGTDWLEQRVDAYLGHTLADEAEVTVTGRVRPSDSGFVLELVTEVAGVRDRQRLRHHDCAALVELAASLSAIAIDPLALVEVAMSPPPDPHERAEQAEQAERAERAERAEQAERAGVPVQRPSSRGPIVSARERDLAPSQQPAASEPPKPPEQPKPDQEPALEFELYADPAADAPRPDAEPRRTRALVFAGGGLALNLFPNPAPQLRGGVGLQRGRGRVAFRAELGAGTTFAGRFRSADGSTGGDLLAWDVSVRPCGVPRWGIVELRVCAGFGAGQIRARGVGVQASLRRNHPWLWLGTDAGVGVELARRVALILEFGADFNVYRPTFSVSGPDASYLTPIVSGHGRLNVELRLF